jgi:pimeloyl-ACP methyl ester carboxylesterase
MVTSPRRYRSDLRAAHERLAALPSRTAHLPAGTVDYLDDGEGPALLMVHGIFGGHDAALRLADPSDLAGRRRLAPSRFGYLGTVMPEQASVTLQADTHAALLDALAIDRAAVLAGSAGTTSALELAVRHPERVAGLVLLSSNAPGPHHDTDGIPEWLARRLWASDPLMWAVRTYASRSISSLMGVPPDLPLGPHDRARLEEELDSIFPVSRRVRGCLFDAFTGNKAINAIPLEEVRAPTLVIHFRDDTGAPFAGAQTLARRIPGAESLFLDHGGHLGLGEHPEVGTTLRVFLDKALPAH